MATTAWIKNMLERRGVPFEELHHRVAFTAQEMAEREQVSGHCVAKVVVVMANGCPAELILAASRRVMLSRVRTLLGAEEVHLASEAEMDRIFTDCETGAIPPLRHWKEVAVLVDASLSSAQEIVFQAGTHEDAIRLKYQDWLSLVKPRVEFFTEPEHASSRATFTDGGDLGSKGRKRASARTSGG